MERRNVRALADHRLAFAVVAEAARLQDRGAAEFADRAHQRAGILDADEGRGFETEIAQEVLLDQPVLRRGERERSGPHRLARAQEFDAGGRHVLEFERDDVDRLREAGERRFVRVGSDRRGARRVVRRRLGLGRVDVAAQADLQRCDREHPPELTGAENAERSAGREDHVGPSVGNSGTASRRASRQAVSRASSSGSESASTEAASSAALTAPAGPIAKVPTGTPAGICTIDSRLSCPDNAWDSIGTPNTGSVVNAAVMPGRCAAPPAPAMITSNPAAFAPLANATNLSGVRCAETMRASWPTPSSCSVSAARRIVGQSDRLPMMMATGLDAALKGALGDEGGRKP